MANTLTRRSLTGLGVSAALSVPLSALGANQKSQDSTRILANEGVITIYQSDERPIMLLKTGRHPPFPVVFDTGTNGNALDLDVAKYLRLRRIPNRIAIVTDGTTGISFNAHGYVLPEIELGSVRIASREVSAYPYKAREEVGIFGPNLFSGQLVFVELGRGRIRISNKPTVDIPRGLGVPYLGGRGDSLPGIEITLPHKSGITPSNPVFATLDSGANSALALPTSFIDKVPLKKPPVIVGQSTSVTGTFPLLGSTIEGDVKIGSVTLNSPEVTFNGLTPNVGLPVLRQLQFVLDPEAEITWMLAPMRLSTDQMAPFVGTYGIRQVMQRDDVLIYRRQDGPERMMTALGFDIFDLEPNSGVQLVFSRTAGKVSGVSIVDANAISPSFPRSVG